MDRNTLIERLTYLRDHYQGLAEAYRYDASANWEKTSVLEDVASDLTKILKDATQGVTDADD